MAVTARTQPNQRDQRPATPFEEVYFDIQAQVDYTKHPGGLETTNELIALCAVDRTKFVLDVGCGVGMTPAYLVLQTGCRVVGLDLRKAMICRAVERANRRGLGERATFVVADARDLPFAQNAFDVVMAESVFALIADQDRAMAECVRVTRIDGAVGIAEINWRRKPPPRLLERLSGSLNQMLYVRSPDTWRALLERAGLHDVAAHNHPINLRSETRSRLQRLGLGHALRIWRQFFSIAWTQPEYRQFVKAALSEPVELVRYWGYGVYVGTK